MATGGSEEMENNLWHEATLLREGNPSVYLIKSSSETVVRESSKIRKYEIGTKNTRNLTEKVIMFVGETGAGKTTMINRVANYLFGVKWEDGERYKLIGDEEEESEDDSSQTKSKTKWITSYTFNQTKTSNWKFTLVDTPGFGDTGGEERDKFITNQIKDFFGTKGEGGIDHIDAVGFVLKANSQRLTEAQIYIFNSVLHLFGKDISKNIFLFVTYADIENYGEDENPAVIEAVEKANVPYTKSYMFNNVALYRDKKKTGRRTSSSSTGNLWSYATEDLDAFFTQLEECEPKSIFLSAEVLAERASLEIIVQSLPARITTCIVELKRIEEEEKALETYRQEKEEMKQFTYIVNEEVQVKKDISPAKANVCTKCILTCHYPCAASRLTRCGSFGKPKLFPDIILRLTKKSSKRVLPNEQKMCFVCPGKCSPEDHHRGNYMFEPKIEARIKTHDDIKQRYEDASKKMNTTEYAITKIKENLAEAQNNVEISLEMLRECLQRLDEIALKPDPLSIADYLDGLIKVERLKGEAGWENRVEELGRILKREKEVIYERIIPVLHNETKQKLAVQNSPVHTTISPK